MSGFLDALKQAVAQVDTDAASEREAAMQQAAEGFAEMAEVLALVVESTNGHRARLLAEGYSETMAEMGAMNLHNAMIQRLIIPWFFSISSHIRNCFNS